MAGHTRIDELIVKKLLGEITIEEEIELQVLGKASEENRELIARMSPEAFQRKWDALRSIDDQKLDRKMKQRMGHIPGVLEWVPETTWMVRAARPWSIAASILLLASVVWWFSHTFLTSKTISHQPIEAKLWSQSDTIELGKMEEGKAYEAGQIRIARMRNQFFIHQWMDSAAVAANAIEYHLTVTGREKIQVFFQDSTRAQIYPGSGISFRVSPAVTLLKDKEMACNGQVLFDVNPHYETPFIVKTPKQVVTVLGTLFAVRDYSKEDTGAVFCYTGKVSVKDDGLAPQTLVAFQRVTVDPKHALQVSTGDFPQAEWSSPELLFDFSNLNLDSAMNEIAHWYGLRKVKFAAGIDIKTPGTVLTGKLSRYLPLQQLLSILERNDLHFSIQGQTILVAGNGDRTSHDH